MQILLIMLIVVFLAFLVLLLALAKQSPREKQTEDNVHYKPLPMMPMYHTQKEIIKNTVTPEDLVVISGGGWMGNLWIHNECVIREIVQNYPNNKIIILPQTVYYTCDNSNRSDNEHE